MSAIATIESPCDSYRRQARRLRAQHVRSPAELQRALRTLAGDVDRAKPVVVQPRDDVKRFAAEVASSLEGSVLRYSARQRLIEQAATLGIRRFDANLLIAAVQHRLINQSKSELLPPMRSANRLNWVIPACVVALLQMMIFGGGYLLIHHLS